MIILSIIKKKTTVTSKVNYHLNFEGNIIKATKSIIEITLKMYVCFNARLMSFIFQRKSCQS